MSAQQMRKSAMLQRVQQFMDAYATELTVLNASAARKELDDLVQEMKVCECTKADIALNAKSQTSAHANLCRDLVNSMRIIALIAAAHVRVVPEFKVLQVPKDGIDAAVLVQDATAMAKLAAEYQQLFVGNGLREDFADALLAAATAVRASIDAGHASITTKAGARAGLEAAGARATLVIRVLDSQIKSALANDRQALDAWSSAKRIGNGKVVSIDALQSADNSAPHLSQYHSVG